MTIKRIEFNANGERTEEIFCSDGLDYDVARREWITSDGGFIREFTIDEYINQDPTETVILPYSIDSERTINVVAHCREYRKYYAKKTGN